MFKYFNHITEPVPLTPEYHGICMGYTTLVTASVIWNNDGNFERAR
jgi:hypothetical protein